MPIQKQQHDQTELEFAAKGVNDYLKKAFPQRNLQFMSFVMDEGENGYLGYLATSRRIDAVKIIFEWLARMLPGFNKAELIEILKGLPGADK